MVEKLKSIAKTIVNYSLELKADEKVLIICQSVIASPLVKALITEICNQKAIPNVNIVDQEIGALLLENTTAKRVELIKKISQFEIDNYDAFINIKYSVNDYEAKNINNDIISMIGEQLKDISDIRINERKWVLINYPSILDAYKSKMKIEEFHSYALKVMDINYQQMAVDIKPLKELMEKTDKVRITGKDTDLVFSIKDMPVIPCVGKNNIPDGEIFTAPIKNSVNGYITYNTPAPYRGKIYTNIKLTFKDGKIISATCNENDEDLNRIFNTDEDSRYIGEFAIGLNPLITEPMGDILYDEKIIGSIHFTPGRSYRDSYNGNNSSIHWDLVLIQRPEYGGGNIYFDDVLIRENGLFVLEELKHLNYGLTG
ncbi:MAG: aminopeptidase [Bacilli bacterium]|jgi:aminopeptidase